MKAKTGYITVTTTCDSRADAEKIAEELVAQRACACAQIFGPILSVYRWKGKVKRSEEWSITAKTRSELFKDVKEIVSSLHSYDVPEIVVLPIAGGSTDYLSWIGEETSP